MSDILDELKPKRTRRQKVEMYYLTEVMLRLESDLHRTVKRKRVHHAPQFARYGGNPRL